MHVPKSFIRVLLAVTLIFMLVTIAAAAALNAPSQTVGNAGNQNGCFNANGQTSGQATMCANATGTAILETPPQFTPIAFASCVGVTNAGTGACNIAGQVCAITDDNTACAFGATIVNGGAHKVLGYCDGTQYVMTECK